MSERMNMDNVCRRRSNKLAQSYLSQGKSDILFWLLIFIHQKRAENRRVVCC